MKYQLETIPVWEAIEASAPCPLCFLAERLETQYVSFYVGDSVMTPEIRVTVNRTGFCPRHFQLMIDAGNKLGVSLMTATHIESLRERLRGDRRRLTRLASRRGPRGTKARRAVTAEMDARNGACLVCDRMDHTMRNYAYTLARMYCDESAFREAFDASSGVCIGHLPFVCEVAGDSLAARRREVFFAALFEIVDGDLAEIHRNLGEFAERFDYRDSRPMTETLRDAVPRAIRKLTGRLLQ